MRYMLGSGMGMAIGDRPFNMMRVRRDRVPRLVQADGGTEISPQKTALSEIDESFSPPAPRLRGPQLQDLEGGWL